MLQSRPGGIVRGKGQFGVDIAPMPVPFVFPQAMEGLEYMDQVRENRTGTNRYFTGIDQNALNKTATGIQQLSTMAAQRVEQIARHFANGIEELFSILHELVLKGGHKTDVVKLRGKWIEVNPAEWRSRTDFKISVGYAAGNKDAMVSRLMLIAQMQEKALAGGLPIANARNAYETAIELTKASDFATPERFWQDPAQAPPPQPPQPDPTIVAAENIKTQSAERIKAADIAQQERESQRQAQIDKYKTDTDASTKLAVAQHQTAHNAQMEQFRAEHSVGMKQFEGQQSAQLEEQKVRLKSQPALEMAGQVQELAGQLQDAVQSMKDALSIVLTAKRQIRRGKDGKAEGVDVVGPDGSVIASQSVQRGPDGRVVGSA
jgi:hypothetical protein